MSTPCHKAIDNTWLTLRVYYVTMGCNQYFFSSLLILLPVSREEWNDLYFSLLETPRKEGKGNMWCNVSITLNWRINRCLFRLKAYWLDVTSSSTTKNRSREMFSVIFCSNHTINWKISPWVGGFTLATMFIWVPTLFWSSNSFSGWFWSSCWVQWVWSNR